MCSKTFHPTDRLPAGRWRPGYVGRVDVSSSVRGYIVFENVKDADFLLDNAIERRRICFGSRNFVRNWGEASVPLTNFPAKCRFPCRTNVKATPREGGGRCFSGRRMYTYAMDRKMTGIRSSIHQEKQPVLARGNHRLPPLLDQNEYVFISDAMATLDGMKTKAESP